MDHVERESLLGNARRPPRTSRPAETEGFGSEVNGGGETAPRTVNRVTRGSGFWCVGIAYGWPVSTSFFNRCTCSVNTPSTGLAIVAPSPDARYPPTV